MNRYLQKFFGEGTQIPPRPKKCKRRESLFFLLSEWRGKNPKAPPPDLEKRVEKLEQIIRDELKIII